MTHGLLTLDPDNVDWTATLDNGKSQRLVSGEDIHGVRSGVIVSGPVFDFQVIERVEPWDRDVVYHIHELPRETWDRIEPTADTWVLSGPKTIDTRRRALSPIASVVAILFIALGLFFAGLVADGVVEAEAQEQRR